MEESEQQLRLEAESQQNFEFLGSQVRSLREAFRTLSETFVEEIDGIKKQWERDQNQWEKSIVRLAKATKRLRGDMAAMQEENERLRQIIAQQNERIDLQKSQIVAISGQIPATVLSAGSVRLRESAVGQLGEVEEKTLRLQKDCSHVKQQLEVLRADHTTAASALAKDVASLAEELAALRAESKMQLLRLEELTQGAADKEKLESNLRTEMETVAKSGEDASVRLEERVERIQGLVSSQAEWMSESFGKLQRQQNKLQMALEDSALKTPNYAAKMTEMETLLRSLRTDINASVVDLDRQFRRKWEAMKQALDEVAKKVKVQPPAI